MIDRSFTEFLRGREFEDILTDALMKALREKLEPTFKVEFTPHEIVIEKGLSYVGMASAGYDFRASVSPELLSTGYGDQESIISLLQHALDIFKHRVVHDVKTDLQHAAYHGTLKPCTDVLEVHSTLYAKYVVGDVIMSLGKEGYLMHPKYPYTGFRILWGDGSITNGITHAQLHCLDIPVTVPNLDQDRMSVCMYGTICGRV